MNGGWLYMYYNAFRYSRSKKCIMDVWKKYGYVKISFARNAILQISKQLVIQYWDEAKCTPDMQSMPRSKEVNLISIVISIFSNVGWVGFTLSWSRNYTRSCERFTTLVGLSCYIPSLSLPILPCPSSPQIKPYPFAFLFLLPSWSLTSSLSLQLCIDTCLCG